jgi:hypothetical protein
MTCGAESLIWTSADWLLYETLKKPPLILAIDNVDLASLNQVQVPPRDSNGCYDSARGLRGWKDRRDGSAGKFASGKSGFRD